MKRFGFDSPLMRFLDRMGQLMWLNILTVVCSLPVITAGAAFAALSDQVLRIAREEEGSITPGYFRAFRANFLQGTGAWLILLAGYTITVLDLYLAAEREMYYLRPFLLMVLFVLVGTALYVFPVLSHFSNTLWRTLKNALLLSLMHLPRTVVMAVLYLIPVGLVWFSERLAPLWVFFGLSVPAWLSAKLYHPVFLKLENPSGQTENRENKNKNEED